MARPTAWPLATIGSLYLAQAVPLGFVSALPVLLRAAGHSLTVAGVVSLVSLPWLLKWIWAARLDLNASPLPRLGQRRGWIVPLQLLSAMIMAGLGWADPAGQLWPLLAGLLLLNFVCATQDIATDGLTVLLLPARERGLGNSLQSIGYYAGQLLGAGLLMVVYAALGWAALCAVAAALLLLPLLPLLFTPEPQAPPAPVRQSPWGALRSYVVQPLATRWLALVVVFLLGQILALTMFKTLLLDRGFTVEGVGWLNMAGTVASIGGALAAGVLMQRLQRAWAVKASLIGVSIGTLTVLLCSMISAPTTDQTAAMQAVLVASLMLNKVVGGFAGATLFTLMMDHTRPSLPGTDFTLQQSVFNLATLLAAGAGVLADALGYVGHFALCFGISVAAAVWWFTQLGLVTSGRFSGTAQPDEAAARAGVNQERA